MEIWRKVDTSRPRIYAQLSDSTNQVPTDTNPKVAQFDTVDEQQGFTFTTPITGITIPFTGLYYLVAGGQVCRASGSGVRTLDLWLRKNDIDIANSGVRNVIPSSTDTKVVINNGGMLLASGDVLKIVIAVDDALGGTGLYKYTGLGGGPAVPSIILTIALIN